MSSFTNERYRHLEQLRTAVEQWYKKEKERLESEVQFLRDVQEGRGTSGVEALTIGPLETLTAVEVQNFLGELPPEEPR